MYSYRVYGLSLVSPIPIDGLLPSTPAPADCELRIGPVRPLTEAERIDLDTSAFIEDGEPGTRIARSRDEAGTFLFEFLDGTRFRIEEAGRRVHVDFSTTTAEDMATYFLGPILAFIVRLRGALSLHAGTVVIGDGAVLISGVAGAGKSTTTAALVTRGAHLLTDDVAVIEWKADVPHVLPGYPRVRLWDDSAASLYGSAENLPLLTPTWSKRFVDARETFAGESVPIRAVIVLARRHDGPVRMRRLIGHEAVIAVMVRTSMVHLLSPEQRRIELDEVTRLVEKVPIIEITPRDDLSAMGELLDAITAAIL